ncbi:hypothetical protein IAQ67_16290 [Paenibacillus peoriae]|uniref:Uncharacterized protein n=1 Tax=Paenibacillus peoriae TaxID=59893 RepID=A0A7H0Y2Z4_9BACL|nr:hypothetical protein IAQ67_16290 [Paenibacillus peoriae]
MDYYDDFILDLEREKEDLEHKLELVQSRIEVYKEKVSDYRTILDQLKSDE